MSLRILKFSFLFLSLVGQVVALDPSMLSNPVDKEQWYAQWFAGPIITPQPFTLPVGHPSLEFDLSVLNFNGEYDSDWNFKSTPNLLSIQPLLFLEGAISKRIGLFALPSLSINFREGQNSMFLNDTPLGIGFQILNDEAGKWTPDLRVLFEEIIPTGKFRNLDPDKNGVDLTGQGSYQTGIFLAAGKFFKFNPPHNMSMRWVIGYFVPSSVHVKGLNFYGGGEGTDGTVRPGNYFTAFYSCDYSITRQWGIGVETNYIQSNSGSFSGRKGINEFGEPNNVSAPSFSQWSLLPWVGRTFDPQTALLLGGWFTLKGRNAPAFYGGILSLLYIF